MEVIEKTIQYKQWGEAFHIYPISDIHFGSVHSAEEEVEGKVLECVNRPNAYALGVGDYVDCITKNDPRFDMEGLAPWVEKGNIVESQRKRAKQLFKPLVEEGKLIALGTGNHEEDIHQKHQDDIAWNLCEDLKVRYAGYSYFLILHFEGPRTRDRHNVIVHAWHGTGAAQTEGARLMRLMRLVNDVEADIYLMGHLHAMTSHTPDRLMCKEGRVKSIKLAATITGSWLRAYTQPEYGQRLSVSYAEKKGYKPSRIGCPVIHIKPDKDEFTIES